jgi:dihydroneopterin aldolase
MGAQIKGRAAANAGRDQTAITGRQSHGPGDRETRIRTMTLSLRIAQGVQASIPSERGPDLRPDAYTIRVRDFVLPLEIGVYSEEHGRRQRVRISIELEVAYPKGGIQDDFGRVPSYDTLVAGLRRLAEAGHVKLVETVAERVLDLAFAHAAVRAAMVEVEKLDIVAEADSVGVRFEVRRV